MHQTQRVNTRSVNDSSGLYTRDECVFRFPVANCSKNLPSLYRKGIFFGNGQIIGCNEAILVRKKQHQSPVGRNCLQIEVFSFDRDVIDVRRLSNAVEHSDSWYVQHIFFFQTERKQNKWISDSNRNFIKLNCGQ